MLGRIKCFFGFHDWSAVFVRKMLIPVPHGWLEGIDSVPCCARCGKRKRDGLMATETNDR